MSEPEQPAPKKPRESIDWPAIRAEYEAGGTFNAISKRHPVTREGIRRRAMREHWTQDLEPAIQRATAAAVAKASATADPEKRQEAVDAEAARRAEVITRHRQEWTQVAALRQEALRLRTPDAAALAAVVPGSIEDVNLRHASAGAAFTAAKLAKITAEMTAIQQAGERRAWRIDAEPGPGGRPGSPGVPAGTYTLRVIREDAPHAGSQTDED